jgi:hypothetical protein
MSIATHISLHVVGDIVNAELSNAQEDLLRLLQYCEQSGLVLDGLEVVRPTLDDVFLDVTGEHS